jgi:peptidyl-prolyl cis-trans isomerase D
MAAVLGLLVVSFAIWGIGDIFRGFGVSTVAQIGRTEITIEQFRRLYNDRMQQLGRQLGRPITPDQARALGLEQQLLGQMLAESALDERARQLRLGISDAEIAKRIMQEPAFRGMTGQFDRNMFLQRIRDAGYTEQRFVAEQRAATLRQQLSNTVTGDVVVPQASAEALNVYQNEERSLEFVLLDRNQAGDIPAPTPEVLSRYFEEHKALFRAPEYRKINIISITPADLAATVEVSDEDVKRAYEDHLSRYTTPERREVQQIVFPNMDEARKASERIAGGLTFAALATERGLKDTDTNLGLITKGDILDQAVADAAFSLKQGEVSAPVQGRFGATLVHVVKIEPTHTRSLADAAPQIKRELALDRAKNDVSDAYNKIEDERAAGSNLDEAAKKLKLPVRTVEAVDRSGRGPDGKPVSNLPDQADLLNAVFSSDVGVETDPIQIPGGGYLWYEVVAVQPSRDRTLDEVKDRVEARWRDDEIASRLSTKASDMVDKLKSGSTLADLAKAGQLKVQTETGVKRSGAKTLSPAVVAAAFRTAKGAAGSADGKDATQRVVFRVTDVKDPPFDAKSPQAKEIEDTLRRSIADELFIQYIGQLENDLGTSVNQSALAQAVGSGTGGNASPDY